MATRRTDDLTAVNVEYAIFLEQTRGSVAALTFAWRMKLPANVVDRILECRLARRAGRDRRLVQRED